MLASLVENRLRGKCKLILAAMVTVADVSKLCHMLASFIIC